MNAEIISVGTELILGDIVNTNAQYLSQKLAAMGIDVFYQSSVGDNPQRLKRVLSIAVSRSNIIILTGGLGPTQDDLTVKTVCEAIGLEMIENAEALENIKSCFAKTGRELTENNMKQAMVPKGATVFQNTCGTAPGCAISEGEQCIILLPGPPSEMQKMFETDVQKYLMKYSDGVTLSKFINIYGIGESKVAEMAGDLFEGSNPTVAPYAKEGEVALRVTAKAQNETAAEAMCKQMIAELENRLGTAIYGVDKDSIQQVAVELLKNKKLTVSTAESCTAGLISKRITEIPGSSEIFNMGVVTYSNESKNKMLNVPMDVIAKHGAVSPQVAALMAKGIREVSGSDIGISITGIAGPGNEGSDKPVGLSYIALSDKNGEYVIESRKGEHHGREYIRYASASEAINLLRLYLISYPGKIQGVTLLDGFEAQKKAEIEFAVEKPDTDEKEDILSSIAKIFGESVPFDKISTMPEPKLIVEHEPKIPIDSELKLQEPIMDPIQPLFDDEPEIKQEVDIIVEPEKAEEPAEQTPAEDDIFSAISKKIAAEGNDNTDAVEESNTDEISMDNDEDNTESVAENEMEDKNESVAEKKENAFIRFVKYLIPWKGDPKKEIARKIVFLAALITLIALTINLSGQFLDPIRAEGLQNKLKQIYEKGDTAIAYSSEIMNPKFNELYKQNKDIIGWIKIGDTKVNYPVVQSKDNDHYLRLSFDGKYNRCGTIYADYKSSITYNKESKNIVLYGHNMKDDKSMFSQLLRYRKLDFYKENPVISFDSLYKDGDWKIFAIMTTNANKEQDNGKVFDYRKSDFNSEEEFMLWVEQCRSRSEINTPVDVIPSDEVLTLQTCAYEFTDARYIVMARRVRQGETGDVDTSLSSVNPNAVYPQAWYDKKGISNPYAATTTTKKKVTYMTFTRATGLTTATMPSTSATSNTIVPTSVLPTQAVSAAVTQAPTQPVVNPTAAATTHAVTTAHATAAPTTAKPTAAPTTAAPTTAQE